MVLKIYNNADEEILALEGLISSGESLKSDLLNILKNTSVHSTGSSTVLYGGYAEGFSTSSFMPDLIDSNPDIRAIDKTAAYEFLTSIAFREKVIEAFGITDPAIITDIREKGRFPPDMGGDWLYHGKTGAWAQAF